MPRGIYALYYSKSHPLDTEFHGQARMLGRRYSSSFDPGISTFTENPHARSFAGQPYSRARVAVMQKKVLCAKPLHLRIHAHQRCRTHREVSVIMHRKNHAPLPPFHSATPATERISTLFPFDQAISACKQHTTTKMAAHHTHAPQPAHQLRRLLGPRHPAIIKIALEPFSTLAVKTVSGL